jgi:RNA polymerase sigma-70 factor (ECF subfamily)
LFDVKGKAQFSTYLIAIAKNLYIDYIRKMKRIVICNIDELLPCELTTDGQVLIHLQYEEICNIIEELPQEQKEAIRMKYLESMTLDAIAEYFDCEPKTVKSRIHNGVSKIRKDLRIGGYKLGKQ